MMDPYIGIVEVELDHLGVGGRRLLKNLISIYNDAESYLIHVVCDHYEELLSLPSRSALTRVEQLMHHTKDNPSPEYRDFDLLFPRFPSYMRRSAIHAALGHVSSHNTRCEQYYEKRQAIIDHGHHYKKMEPGFTFTPNSCPTLYKKNNFSIDILSGTVNIKIYAGNDWEWFMCSIPNRDRKSLIKAINNGGTVKNPKLVYKFHKFYLQFPVKYKGSKFSDVPLEDQTVLSVDLGFNSPAIGSVVDLHGSVHGRSFTPFKEDMARIDHVINLIRKYQRMSGKGQSLSSLYTKLAGLKMDYVRQLSHWIVESAVQAGVYGIVLEQLISIHHSRSRGTLKARVHHWCVAKIRDLVKGLAFRKGIRVFLVNPNGTSMYAFDGSGKVTRDADNYSLCTFTTGKRYNCDLSAAYNIASRYFLRAVQKSMSEKAWLALKAKVPELSKRTTWTLATLRSVARYKSTSPLKACVA